MATTLAQVTTDAAIPADVLTALLREACDASFNVISVDGSTSTNDCILVLANGAAGVAVQGAADAQAFGAALTEVLLDLAKQIVADGEGATRYARYEITGARDDAEARAAARAVGENPLVRCALHGSDPNWGRMLTALGSCGVDLDPDAVDLWIGDVQVVAGGAGIPDTEQAAHAALDRSAVEVRIDLALGTGCAVLYASDLSPAYVRFNAEYST
jgi:glutamate N-acetyltransferase/amino-acid N-acetyltransferase